MTDARESWKDIGSKLESLGLKLKYHFAQERSEEESEDDDGAMQKLSRAIDDVTDSVENAAKDGAVKADVKDIFSALPGALTDTFQQLAGDVKHAIEKRKASDGVDDSSQGGPPTDA